MARLMNSTTLLVKKQGIASQRNGRCRYHSSGIDVKDSSGVRPAASISAPIILNSLSASSILSACFKKRVGGQPKSILPGSIVDSSIHAHIDCLCTLQNKFPNQSKTSSFCKQDSLYNACLKVLSFHFHQLGRLPRLRYLNVLRTLGEIY